MPDASPPSHAPPPANAPPPADAPSPLDAPSLTHAWAQLLVAELVRHGVEAFFVAPGSRSTPLTTAVARHPGARAVVHYDERGTAFAALGYGRAAGRPAAWITTSGTAVANGLPAVAEASVAEVPMLLLTADRPPELRTTGANQTIDQVKLFGDHVRWFFDLPAPTPALPPAMVLTAAAQAVHRAVRTPPGPVHLNCMFRKPLEPVPDGFDVAAHLADLAGWAASDAPYTRYPTPAPAPPVAALDALACELRGVARGLVVCGQMDGSEDAEAALALARALGWPLVPDACSGLRFGGPEADEQVPEGGGVARVPYHALLAADDAFAAAHRPEAAIHLGGTFVSKALRLALDAARPRPWVVARPSPARLDPTHAVTHHVEAAVAPFARALAARVTDLGASETDEAAAWRAAWTRADRSVHAALEAFAEEALAEGTAEALSEPLVARLVTRERPAGHALVLASSMPVRDATRYGHPHAAREPFADDLVVANRGASGIDGTVATAAGVALATGRPATLLTGDLALLHDQSSLPMLRRAPVVVVVVNNDGGGIFHFLPIAAHADVFEPYFGTPHGLGFADAARMVGLAYRRPATPAAFAEAYRAACAEAATSGASAVIEVRTERAANRALHAELAARVRDSLSF